MVGGQWDNGRCTMLAQVKDTSSHADDGASLRVATAGNANDFPPNTIFCSLNLSIAKVAEKRCSEGVVD